MNEKKNPLQKLMGVLNYIGSMIVMSLVFLACCIPVVTMGKAWCALLTAVRYMIRKEDWWDGFKFGMKIRFWRGLLAWTAMLIPIGYFLLELHHGYAQVVVYGNMDNLPQLISACLMLALMTMLASSLMILNVYVPTKISLWVNSAVSMVFKAPLQLLLCSVLFWLPFIMALLWPAYLYFSILIFLVAYFPLTGLLTTMLLKNTLLEYLLTARKEGTLLAEEGAGAKTEA